MKRPPKVAALIALTLILSSACACGAARPSVTAKAVTARLRILDTFPPVLFSRRPDEGRGPSRHLVVDEWTPAFAGETNSIYLAGILLRGRHALEERDAAQQIDRAHELIVLVGAEIICIERIARLRQRHRARRHAGGVV